MRIVQRYREATLGLTEFFVVVVQHYSEVSEF
ncbi:hypothetical protein J2W46_003124 [Paraburkholderia strydomiana]|nr:hypothetical protein [Paraburkholderia strydomiana]